MKQKTLSIILLISIMFIIEIHCKNDGEDCNSVPNPEEISDCAKAEVPKGNNKCYFITYRKEEDPLKKYHRCLWGDPKGNEEEFKNKLEPGESLVDYAYTEIDLNSQDICNLKINPTDKEDCFNTVEETNDSKCCLINGKKKGEESDISGCVWTMTALKEELQKSYAEKFDNVTIDCSGRYIILGSFIFLLLLF